MKKIVIICFACLSNFLIAQTYLSNYSGVSNARTHIGMKLDSVSSNTDLFNFIAPASVQFNYNLQIYSNDNYIYGIQEVTKGHLMGMDLQGDIEHIFVDKKNKLVYINSEKKIFPISVESLKSEKNFSNTSIIIDGNDTATIYFDKLTPKEITGFLVFDNNKYGVSEEKCIYNSFKLISWKKTNAFDFEKELARLKNEKFTKNERVTNIVFLSK